MKVFIDASFLVYLNVEMDPGRRRVYEDFYSGLLSKFKAYTDVIVLDELIFVSAKKYNVPYELTIEFVKTIVLPFVEVLPLGEEEYLKAAELLLEYRIKPSDSLHISAMMLNGIERIVSEDREFDMVKGIVRVWPD